MLSARENINASWYNRGRVWSSVHKSWTHFNAAKFTMNAQWRSNLIHMTYGPGCLCEHKREQGRHPTSLTVLLSLFKFQLLLQKWCHEEWPPLFTPHLQRTLAPASTAHFWDPTRKINGFDSYSYFPNKTILNPTFSDPIKMMQKLLTSPSGLGLCVVCVEGKIYKISHVVMTHG